ncbi:MAG TPA: HAMP domain-containing sensor histidine kinase [Candidatus Baltobacteraceae bacterium]
MGHRLQAHRGSDEGGITLRLAGSYLAVFLVIIAALSAIAYTLIAGDVRDLLEPVLTTPEGQRALHGELRTVLFALLAGDAGLALLVATASYLLARAAVRPLVLARLREERFAGDVAHELRTPLGVIASVAQAARGGDPATHDAAFQTVATQALDAGALITDLLTLARAGDAQALLREPVDLFAIAQRVVNDELPNAQARNIALTCDGCSAIVEGEAPRLRALLRNLIENALEHANTRVAVSLSVAGQWAQLTIEDDGPGVEPAIAEHLFERFVKGSESRGSGLGLAICRWVVQAHGGRIIFEGGSRFVTMLPLGNYGDIEGVETE